MLNRPYSTEEDVQRITTQYIRFLTRYQRKKKEQEQEEIIKPFFFLWVEQFLKSSEEFAQVAYKLIDSKVCLDFSTVVLGHVLNNHALLSQDITELLVSYSLLLYAGKDEPRWMNYILLESISKRRNRLFCKIVTEVRLGFYTTFKMLSVSFALLFEMCKLAKVEKDDLGKYLYVLWKSFSKLKTYFRFVGYLAH